MKYGDISPAVAAYSVVDMLKRAEPPLTLDRFGKPAVVTTIDEFRALPGRERARRTIDALKRMGRFTNGMKSRELEDYEVVAALLLGNGEIE